MGQMDKAEEIYNKAVTNNKLMYLPDGKKKIKINGKEYQKIKKDENGMPVKFSKKDFKERVEIDKELFRQAMVVMNHNTIGQIEGQNKDSDDPRAYSGSFELQDDDLAVEVSRHLNGRIMAYITGERMADYPKIFSASLKKTSKPRKVDLRVFGNEWVEFFREAASQRLFGTKSGKPATDETKESHLLFPPTAEGQKDQFPYLFGYSSKFKDSCICQNGFIQKMVHHFFAINNSKNEDDDDEKEYVRVKIDGERKKVKKPTYKIPEVMRKTLAGQLEKVKKKASKGDDPKPFSLDYFSNNLIISLCVSGSEDDKSSSKATMTKLKEGSSYEKVCNAVVEQENKIKETVDTAREERANDTKERKKNKPSKKKKSTKKAKTVSEKRKDLASNDNRE